ncbi:TPA: hypothetical protein ACFNMI_000231 [Neisseria bacilliformis]|uniref:hypothetical protein n=1 Tax=Neisseria bacilliformis TaxID=267212 RepID=UPI0028EF5236|nr:hypothetical protein [Neisseria bacilliformis]
MSPRGDARVPCAATNPPIPKQQPRAWLRHTPYLSGRGRLKNKTLCTVSAHAEI